MNAIVAVDQNWGIGYEGCLLVHIPEDLRYFRKNTLGKVVVMGRKTFDSLPGKQPLADRTNIVLSRDPLFDPGCRVCRSMEELYQELSLYPPEDIYIIGGASVYAALLPYCGRVLVTKIQKICVADCYFPDLDCNEEWMLVNEGPVKDHGDVTYSFTEYRRR